MTSRDRSTTPCSLECYSANADVSVLDDWRALEVVAATGEAIKTAAWHLVVEDRTGRLKVQAKAARAPLQPVSWSLSAAVD